jgi:hypothetical protein
MFRAGLLLIITRTILYIQQLVYVMSLCRLAASRIGVEQNLNKYYILFVLILQIYYDARSTKT